MQKHESIDCAPPTLHFLNTYQIWEILIIIKDLLQALYIYVMFCRS